MKWITTGVLLCLALGELGGCKSMADVAAPPPPPPPPGRPVPEPTTLAFAEPQYGAVVSDMTISPAIAVSLVNDTGAVCDSCTAKVTLSLQSPVAKLSGTTTVSAVGGVARFTDLAIDKAALNYVLTATSPGLRDRQMVIGVVPSAPARVAFRTSPRPVVAAGGTLLPRPVIEIQDKEGNLITGAADTVTLSLALNPDSARLTGTTRTAATKGVATFDDLVIDRPGRGLVLRASDGALIPAGVSIESVPAVIDTPAAVPGGIAFTQLGGAGDDHRCGLIADGTAYCWGLNDQGQLGNGSTAASVTPVSVAGNLHFSAISVGSGFTCALATDRRTWCWGGTSARTTPQLVDSTLSFVQIDASGGLCGLTAGGRVYCGLPLQPAFADTVPPFTAMITSWARSCGLTAIGAVYCNAGFGTGDSYRWELPEPESQGSAFVSLSGDGYHNCGLTSDGTAWCWGQNDQNIFAPQTAGEVGDGTTTSTARPVAVTGGFHFLSVSAGFGHTCGVTTAGDAWCWGTNAVSELGTAAAPDGLVDNGTPYMKSPVPVVGGHHFARVYAGWGHTCALTSAGQAWCWGSNHEGELWQTPAGLRYLAMLGKPGLRRFSIPQ